MINFPFVFNPIGGTSEIKVSDPVEVLERGGVYLPDSVSVEFKKEKDQRPKVIVYENEKNSRRKLLELKLVMVAEQ